MSGELLILLALGLPLFAAVVTYAVGRMPDVRETLTIVACIALCIVTISIFVRVGQGGAVALTLVQPAPGLAGCPRHARVTRPRPDPRAARDPRAAAAAAAACPAGDSMLRTQLLKLPDGTPYEIQLFAGNM